jgi:hypothetical protein
MYRETSVTISSVNFPVDFQVFRYSLSAIEESFIALVSDFLNIPLPTKLGMLDSVSGWS